MTTNKLPFAKLARRPTIVGDGVILALSQATIVVASVVGTRVLVEVVPPAIYGEFSLCLGVILLARNFFSLPLSLAVTRFHPELTRRGTLAQLYRHTSRLQRRCGLVLTVPLLLSCAVAMFSGQFSVYLPVICFGLALMTFQRDLATSFLNADRRHRLFAIWECADAFAKPLLAIVIVLLVGAHVEAILSGYLVAATAVLVVLTPLTRVRADSQGDLNGHYLEESFREFRSFVMPLMALTLLAWLVGLGDRYVIAWFGGTAEVGPYALTYALISQPFLMIGRIGILTFRPHYFQAIARGDHQRERQILRTWITLVALVGCFGVLVVAATRPWIAAIMLPPAYRNAAGMIPWIAAGHVFFTFGQVLEFHLQGRKLTTHVLIGRAIGAVAAIAAGWPLIWAYGMWGAALACPIYFSVQCAATIVLCWQGRAMRVHSSSSIGAESSRLAA